MARKSAPASGDNPARTRAKPEPLPEPWMPKFLAMFAITANVSASAVYAGTSRKNAYDWRNEHPQFAAEWAEAEQQAADRVRREVFRRGVEGWDEPVYGRDSGKDAGTVQVGSVRRYDSRLLLRMAEARCPEYKRKQEVTLLVKVGNREIDATDPEQVNSLSRPELEALAESMGVKK